MSRRSYNTSSAPFPSESSSAPAPWERFERKLTEQRAPRCPATYDKADSLLRQARKGHHRCGVHVDFVTRAIQAAYLGPCKRARKMLRRARSYCGV
jgi:hypothetical protein